MRDRSTRALVTFLLATTSLVVAGSCGQVATRAHAQMASPPTGEQAFSFNIPAQPLPQALNEIGRIAGLSIVLTDQHAFSVTAHAVVGTFTAQQALATALADTGISYRFTNSRTVTVVRPITPVESTGAIEAPSDSVVLDTIDVDGAGGARGSGGVVGYLATRTSTATKTNTPLIDVPQSVSVVTQELIQDRAIQSMADAVRYMPGVNIAQGEGNRDAVVIRGQASTADFFVDGVRDDVQYYRDFYNVDRVEALKGPNAMIFGRGGGGGVINRVMKQAEFRPFHEVLLQGGSFGNKRAQADVGQALNDQVAFRINGMYEDSGSFRDFVTLNRYGINPTLTFAPSDKTRIKLSYEYFHDDRTADRGIPSYQGRPFRTNPSTFFGNPWESPAWVDVHAATALVEHETDSGIKIRNYSRFANYDKFYQNVFPGAVNTASTQVSISAYNNATDRSNLFNQTDINYTLDTGFIRHNLLAGTEFGLQKTSNFRNTGFFNDRTTSVSVSTFAPITFAPITFRQSASDANNFTETTVAAAYVQDQMEITKHFQIIGGLRFDRYNVDFRNNRTGEKLSREDNLLAPRVGVVVKPVDNLAFYGSYSVSYLPSSGDQFASLTVTQEALKPEKFTNYEAGVKWDIFPTLMLTAAVYQLDRTNTTAVDPNNPAVVVQTGSQRTTGLEIGLNGYVTDAWQVAGGYAYQDARIINATSAAPAGAIVPLVPRHTFSLWNKYQFNPMWGAGIGVIYQSEIYAGIDNTVILPGFTRVDAAVFFKLNDNIRAQINVENIFDVGYYPTAHSNNNISPGSPRAVKFALVGTF